MPEPNDPDEHFMKLALREALDAYERDEVPVGAVIVRDGRVVARGSNQREMLNDPTAHAEMLALTAAAGAGASWRLDDCDIYVTLEPCPMCAGALVNARVRRLIFGAHDPKAGACGSLFNLVQDSRLNHRIDVRSGVLAADCAMILREFFRAKRAKAPGGMDDVQEY